MLNENTLMVVAFVLLQAGTFLLMATVLLWALFSRRWVWLRATLLVAAFLAVLPTRGL